MSLSHGFVPYILIPLFVILGILLVLDLEKRRYLLFAPIGAALLAFGMCFSVFYVNAKDTLDISYIRNNKNEAFAITQGTATILCDQSSGSLSSFYTAYNAAKEKGVTEIDALVLTHYHENHAQSVLRFCQKYMVRSVYLPYPITTDELPRMNETRNAVASLGIEVKLYQYGTSISLFDTGRLTVDRGQDLHGGTHPPLSITIRKGKNAVCYHSADSALLTQNAPFHHNCRANTLFVGAHGSTLSSLVAIPRMSGSVYVCEESLAPYIQVHAANTREIATKREDFILQ